MMILKSFIPGNLISLYMTIINSVVMVGLYYGFLTTLSICPSYIFLLRARVMEEGEEGTEKRVSATTGFIAGQLMMFISIYYVPLHLALGKPHTITVLALPYLLFHFFWNNHKDFFDHRRPTRNSMRNLSIQSRLVNIYMFRCNNNMLFVTSSFVGWLIVWIQQNNLIRSNVLIRSNKYLVSEFQNSMARIFSILLFITCVYYLGRIPSPILTKKLKGISETEEVGESEEERNIEIETISEGGGANQKQGTEENTSSSLFSEEEVDPSKMDETEKLRVTGKKKKRKGELHFRFKETYSKNRSVYETSYLDGNQESSNDGKEKISFTYPPSLATFGEMIQKKYFFTPEKLFSDELYTDWSFINELKRRNFSTEFIKRVESLEKESFDLGILEKRTRFSNNETKREYLPKLYDPFLHRPYRGRIKKWGSPLSINQTYKKNTDPFWINKIHALLLTTDYHELEQTLDTLNIKSLATEKEFSLLTLIEDEQGNIDSEDRVKILKFLFNIVITNPNNQTIRKKSIGIKEISKKVPRWSYKLIDDLEQQEGENEENVTAEHEIRSRKSKRVVIFTNNQANADTYTNTKDANDPDQTDEVALIRYSQQSDFRRDIIKGSMRAQRRKTITWELFQANVHSPLFLDRVDKPLFFSFDISGPLKRISRNWICKNKESKISDYTEKKIEKKDEAKRKKYKREEKMRIEIAEAWDSLLLAQWSEDLTDWNREMHVKCTYNGVQLSETEFPKNWLTDGIQIKILFPFCLKPWHRFKLQPSHKDPMKKKKVWGMETELPFSSPRKRQPYELGETKKDSIIRSISFQIKTSLWVKTENHKRDPYAYGSPFQVNKREESSYHYNMDKQNFFDTLRDIPIHNYLGEGDIRDAMGNFLHRKNKVDIESWVDTSTKSNKNIKTVVKNYQIIDKMDLFYFTIYQDQESNPSNKKGNHFDWMGLNEEILKFVLLYNAYKVKPWIIPIKLLLFNFNGNRNINKNIIENKKRDSLIAPNEKQIIGLENRNQEEKEPIGEGGLVSDAQKQGNFKSVLSNQEKDVEEDYDKSDKRKQLDFFLKSICLLLRLINPNEIVISSIQRGEMNLDILMIQKDLTLRELMKKGILIIDPVRLSVKNDGQFILYQTINKNNYDLFVPENILSPNHWRELRIRISFNSRDKNVLTKNKHLGSDKKKLIKLKFFLWPNYRLEDLACMNRYWFNTNNGSRFSMIRIRMYPRLKIR
ncbi:hypothetical protein V6Z12_D03G089900 [Gossypium hirsutum]